VKPIRPVAAALLTLLLGCDRGRARDEEAAPQPVPTVQPQQPQQPQQPNNNGGGFQIPGLPGLPGLPIPVPGLGNNNGPPPRLGDPAPLPQGAVDAYGGFTEAFQQMEARSVLAELVAALEPAHQQRVAGVPLNFPSNPAEVNAAAGCDRTTRQAFMLITRGILRLMAATSEARAVDEAANSTLLNQYMDVLVQRVRAEQEVIQIPPGSVPPHIAMNPQKLARQRFLFSSQLAFVLGHELAHHYRGHTGCQNTRGTNQSQTDMESILRTASSTVPPFNQPLEAESDTWGIVSTLDAGRRRGPAAWNEDGAMLSMDFFQRLEGERGRSPILIFVRTHPPAILRRPIIQLWASNWRGGSRPSAGNNNGGNNNGGNNSGNNNGGNNNGGGTTLPFPFPIQLPGAR
jgi:hypothetical protein